MTALGGMRSNKLEFLSKHQNGKGKFLINFPISLVKKDHDKRKPLIHKVQRDSYNLSENGYLYKKSENPRID